MGNQSIYVIIPLYCSFVTPVLKVAIADVILVRAGNIFLDFLQSLKSVPRNDSIESMKFQGHKQVHAVTSSIKVKFMSNI